MADKEHVAVRIARVYDEPDPRATTVLVDRLWPRGLARAHAPFGRWMKDVAPTTELRRWYGHQTDRFDEFARRYEAELAAGPAADALAELRAWAVAGPVVLVTATKDLDHAAAAVLQRVLADGSPPGPTPARLRGPPTAGASTASSQPCVTPALRGGR